MRGANERDDLAHRASQAPLNTWGAICRRVVELEGAEEANERARALLAEQRGKLAEAREFLQDRQESIAALQAQLAVKDAQVSIFCNGGLLTRQPHRSSMLSASFYQQGGHHRRPCCSWRSQYIYPMSPACRIQAGSRGRCLMGVPIPASDMLTGHAGGGPRGNGEGAGRAVGERHRRRNQCRLPAPAHHRPAGAAQLLVRFCCASMLNTTVAFKCPDSINSAGADQRGDEVGWPYLLL